MLRAFEPNYNSWRHRAKAESRYVQPLGSNIVVRLCREVTGSLASGGMNGCLILQSADALTSAFTNLPTVILTWNDAFDGTGHRNYTNAVDNVRKFYKAVVQ